ncbi:hypothetical protein [Streptosporangium jomthongense]|uniref:Uncharacterized protein n=1 Tax=Streptosporangium jomthongense TaxID=1193683 RepID=A0ABV8FGT6_9ACTN
MSISARVAGWLYSLADRIDPPRPTNLPPPLWYAYTEALRSVGWLPSEREEHNRVVDALLAARDDEWAALEKRVQGYHDEAAHWCDQAIQWQERAKKAGHELDAQGKG